MSGLIQIITGALGTLGFATLFHLRGKKMLLSGLGGFLSWGIFLILEPLFASEATRYLLSAAVITVYSEILARLMRTPTTTFLVPSCIPLIPGGALYYTMNYALNKQWSQFAHQAFYTLQLALSLAVGIIAVTTVVRLITSIITKQKAKHPAHHYHHIGK